MESNFNGVKPVGELEAEACRYLAGGILRGVGTALPTLMALTGLLAGCWGRL